MKQRILEILEMHYELTGGMCGLRAIDIKTKLQVEYGDIRPVLNELYQSKLITIHPGIQGFLIKLNYKNDS